PLGVWRRKAMRDAVLPHRGCLMGSRGHIPERACRAQKNEPGRKVFGEIQIRPALVDVAVNKDGRATETTALMADRRECNAGSRSSIPDKFVFIAIDGVRTVGRFETHMEGPNGTHGL